MRGSIDLSTILGLLGSLCTLIWLVVYYSSPKLSVCFRCGIQISDKAERHQIKAQGENRVVCGSCQAMLNEIGLQLDTTGRYVKACKCCQRHLTHKDIKNYVQVGQHLVVLCHHCTVILSEDKAEEVMLSALLSPEFLATCCHFNSWQEFARASGVVDMSQDTLNSTQWNQHVRATTTFVNWQEMNRAASYFYKENRLKVKLGLQ